MRKINFFDTTLRDGEQSPGVNLNTQEKLAIAKQLERLGQISLKRGFPLRPEVTFQLFRKLQEPLKIVQ